LISRRKFIYTTTLLSSVFAFANNEYKINTKDTIFMPDESFTHKRTWMAFVASYDIWAKKQVPEVKRNLALIAKTIAKYEPVNILVSKEDRNEAIKLLDGLDSHNYPIELIEFKTNDLWMRDTAPIFVYNNKNEKEAINFNFNGWGEKQEYFLDSKVSDFVAKKANVKSINTKLVLEGGCFEVDGEGMAILTESCILNDNRNPNISKTEVENELKYLLGLEKIIWLKGIKGKDITDGHTDFYVRFANSKTLVVSYDPDKTSYDHEVTKQNIEILKNETDLNGNNYELIIMEGPMQINEKFGISDFAAGYIGYYVCNEAVIMQSFGDEQADKNAKNTIQKLFPNRIIEQINIDGIASGGGSIHCATQQEPADL